MLYKQFTGENMKQIPSSSHFPLLIQYEGNRRVKVFSPEEIENGKPFNVIETNYNRDDLKSYAEVAWEEDKADGILDSTDPWP